MKDSRPLEFLLWRAAIVLGVSLVFLGGGRGSAAMMLNLLCIPQTPDIPRHIPGYTKNPMSFDMGFSVQK